MSDLGERTPLFRRNREAEYELDLRGLDTQHSIASVERMLERNRFRKSRSVRILIDAPDGQGSKSAFQPIGRLLLDARKRGILYRIETLLQEESLGFHIVTMGRQEAGETETDPVATSFKNRPEGEDV